MIMTTLRDMEVSTGSHSGCKSKLTFARSLLVVNRKKGYGIHYDSLNQRNEEVAKATLTKISALLNQRRFPSWFTADYFALTYATQPCPQQANVSDCGIHVLYNTRVIVQRIMYGNYRPKHPWDLSDIDPDTAKNRADLRMLFQRRFPQSSSSVELDSHDNPSQ